MKKHKPWRVLRNMKRRMVKAMSAIDNKDIERAEWFNATIAEKMKEHGGFCVWYIYMPKVLEWPDVTDMYIRCSERVADSSINPGDYVVRGIAHRCGTDVLLDVTNLDTHSDDLMWFPRTGQTVIPCKEYA